VITLVELRAHAKQQLAGMLLLRPGNRLSVMPVAAEHWKFIIAMV
jgi:predicted RNA-binding protein with PUA-like domain